MAVYAYFAGFVGNIVVPKMIDSPAGDAVSGNSVGVALAVDVGLLLLFCVQHSVMARQGFKEVWTKFMPEPIERSTYLLASNLALMLMMWQWQTLPGTVWNVSDGPWRYLMWVLFATGWLLVPVSSLMISHIDLFGLRQVWLNWRGKEYTALPFRTPMLYSHVRHPLYVGWFLAFWMTPTMSVGHLLLASVLSVYMVVASRIEERDLVYHFGGLYEDYRRRVPAFVPRLRRRAALEMAGDGRRVRNAEWRVKGK